MFRVTFTDGSHRDIDADGYLCPEKVTQFRKRNPKNEDGTPPEKRFRTVEEIKTNNIKGIEEIT